jgi:hypothetical protein
MTAISLPSKPKSVNSQLAEWAVIALTVVALLAGWLIKNGVETRSVAFQAGGVSAQTPQGWLKTSAQVNEILRVTDPNSGGFGTTYIVKNFTGSADITTNPPSGQNVTFDQMASLLILDRGLALTSYRVLGEQQVTVFGQDAYEISYVYVESDPNVTHNDLPNIVRGLDYIFLKGDHAIVVTYWADENAFQSDLGRFQRFLGSLKF